MVETVRRPDGSRGRFLAVAIIAGSLLASLWVSVGSRDTVADRPMPASPDAGRAVAAPTREASTARASVPAPSPTSTPVPTPTQVPPDASGSLPYAWAMPAGSDLQRWVAGPVTGFSEGADRLNAEIPLGDGGFRVEIAGQRGVVVATVTNGYLHECPVATKSRVSVRTDPRGLLEEFRTISKIQMTDPVETTFDGRPAWFTTIESGTEGCGADLHVGGRGGTFIPLGFPARVYAFDVDGATIVIETWARTPDDLADFLPTARELLASIHFPDTSAPATPTARPTSSPTPTARPSLTSPSPETDWLSYAIPDGSGLKAWEDGSVTGFTEGADHPYKEAPGARPEVAGRRGVMIATLRDGSFHRCFAAGRKAAQTTPTGILADIRVILQDVVHPRASHPPAMDEPAPTTFDGRPAWSAAIVSGPAECTHIHVGTKTGGWVPLGFPSRVVAVDLDGLTVLIVTWARTPEDLADFLPTAQKLLDSVHFAGPRAQ